MPRRMHWAMRHQTRERSQRSTGEAATGLAPSGDSVYRISDVARAAKVAAHPIAPLRANGHGFCLVRLADGSCHGAPRGEPPVWGNVAALERALRSEPPFPLRGNGSTLKTRIIPSLLLALLIACGGAASVQLDTLPRAPAAVGVIEVKRGPNDNTVGKLRVEHMAPPTELGSELEVYVAWARPPRQ